MVRVLSEDYYLYLIERAKVEGIEDFACWWVADMMLIFFVNEGRKALEVILLELFLQGFTP